MHSAPAVAYPVARSARAGMALAVLVALAAAPGLWWAYQGAAVWSLLAVGAVWIVASVVAVLQWRRTPRGQLRWDGEAWWWSDPHGERGVRPRVRLDLQAMLLVQTAGPFGWHWLESGVAPSRWDDLRRALQVVRPAAAASA